ncbi:hypothetical protein Tco_1457835 [Tanacetum coccineum]
MEENGLKWVETLHTPRTGGGDVEKLGTDLVRLGRIAIGGDVVDLTDDENLTDEDGDIGMGDSKGVSASLGRIAIGTGAKYQVDETHSTRLRYRSLTKNEGKTSSKVEPDTEPLQLQTYVDTQAFLLSNDEFEKESDEEVLAAGDDMDEDTQADDEVRTPSPKQDQPEPSQVQESAFDSSSLDLKKFDNTLSFTKRLLIKYLRKVSRTSIDQYYKENLAHRYQTDKLVEASMSSLDKSSATISDLYKILNVITGILKDISNVVKDDHATNQKHNEATETYAKISSNITENDTSEIKSMMIEMYHAFRGQPCSAPSGNVTPTLALTDIKANVEWENVNTTATEEPPSHTKGETKEPKLAIPISSIPSTTIPPTQAQPITSINPESSQATPKIDKGKRIATESDDDPSKKLVKASSIVCPDPDEPVRDKEEQIKKAEEEARLLAMTKPEVIKVVQEEAKKLGLDPKEIKGAKAGEIKHKYDISMWTISSRLKPEPITDIKIHPKTKPVVITVYRGNDGRKFKVHEPFLFGAFGISELDELREIIPKKKNAVELGIHFALPAPEQVSSRSSGKKQKHMELEPETRIPGLECNRALPENVPFVNNMVIEEPEYGIFSTDEFGDQAFQRWSDIDKVGMEALVSYLVAASMVKSPKNTRFSMKLRKLIAEHPA